MKIEIPDILEILFIIEIQFILETSDILEIPDIFEITYTHEILKIHFKKNTKRLCMLRIKSGTGPLVNRSGKNKAGAELKYLKPGLYPVYILKVNF